MEARSASCRSLRSLPQMQCITNRGAPGCDCCPRLYNFFSHRQFTVVLRSSCRYEFEKSNVAATQQSPTTRLDGYRPVRPSPLNRSLLDMFSSHES